MSHSVPECGMGTRFRIVPVRNWNAEILVHVGKEMFLTRSEYDRYLVCYCDLGAQTREGGRGGGDRHLLSLGAPVHGVMQGDQAQATTLNLITKLLKSRTFLKRTRFQNRALCWPSHVVLREYCKTSGLLSKHQKIKFKTPKPELQT